jgi:hypothetical protein
MLLTEQLCHFEQKAGLLAFKKLHISCVGDSLFYHKINE